MSDESYGKEVIITGPVIFNDDEEVKLLENDEIPKFRPLNSIDYITQWTRDERYLINKYQVEMMEKENGDS